MIHPEFTTTVLFCMFMGAFAYRIRGGGWFTFSSDTECRLIWGTFGLSIPFSMLQVAQGNHISIVSLAFCLYLVGAAFLTMMITHAFAQNAGSLGRPWTLGPEGQIEPTSKYWPGAWLPHVFTSAQWAALSNVTKTTLDFFGMLSSAFIQGAIAFGFPMLVALILGCFGIEAGVAYVNFFRAWVVITIGSPIAYLAGRFTPGVDPSLQPGATWGEFYTGGFWVLALAQL